MNGINTLKSENGFYISKFGMWIYINDKEYFINFDDYPSLAKCTVEELGNYSFDMENNIHWEELDIDIEKEALDEPNKYTLLYR